MILDRTLHDLARELRETLGRPRQPRLAEARAAVAACTRSRMAALEALAVRGLIPMDWVGDPARRFRRGRRWAEPIKSAHAVALAADPEGVLAAEQLARDYARRLRYFGAPALDPAAVVWTFRALKLYARRSSRDDAFFARRYHRVADLLDDVSGQTDPLFTELPGGRRVVRRYSAGGWPVYETSVLFTDIRQSARLRAARASGLEFETRVIPERWWTLPPAEQARRTRVESCRFDALPDPFEPLLAIWRLGYALGPFDGDAVELIAPPAAL